jgi:hypothetical protein
VPEIRPKSLLCVLIIVSATLEIMHDPLVSKLQIESQRHVSNLVETMINTHLKEFKKTVKDSDVEKHAEKLTSYKGGISMKLRVMSQMVTVLFVFLTISVVGASDFVTENNAGIYDELINEVINNNDTKAIIGYSTCKAIRRDVAIACMKSAYYKTFKQEFIKQMSEQNIGPKQYKVKYFLNQRFFELVRSRNKQQS